MNREHLMLWVEDLETTTEPQLDGRLEIGHARCCLGRLCRVAMANGANVDTEIPYGETTFDGDAALAPPSVIAWLGVEYDDHFDQSKYSDLNDVSKRNFQEIAAVLREDFGL